MWRLYCVLIMLPCSYSASTKIKCQDSVPGLFPYVVSIQDIAGKHYCDGCIIDKQWILASKSCIDDKKPFRIVAGTISLKSGGVPYEIEKVVPHKTYGSISHIHDLVLLKTKTIIKFNDSTKPASVLNTTIEAGKSLVFIGWQMSNKGGTSLQYIVTKVIEQSKCEKEFLPTKIFSSNMCTLVRNGLAPCFGNSGSLLVLHNKVYGVITREVPCAKGKPDISARINKYEKWISQVISKN